MTELTTAKLSAASGYCVQQIRDLERLGVIPSARRRENNYRVFADDHVLALRAYRGLVAAVGPSVARHVMREARRMPLADAAAVISALHVGLAKERQDALAAVSALQKIRTEVGGEVVETDDDAMTISELADALGVRPSTLRFWEHEGWSSPSGSPGSVPADTHPRRSARRASPPPFAPRDTASEPCTTLSPRSDGMSSSTTRSTRWSNA